MTPVLSTYLLVGHRLTSVWLERAWDAGFPQIEIFCARQHLDYRDKAQITELGHWFRDSNLKVRSVHAPLYSDDVWGRSGPQSIIDITERTKARRIAMIDELKRALEVADTIPFRYFIQHVGLPGQEYDEWRTEAAFSSLEELKVFSAQRGVEVLLENTPNAISTGERLNLFLNSTHLNLNYCLDVGHAHLASGVGNEFNEMKSRIRSVHLHDNDGKSDSHLLPGEGTIDWKLTMKLLRLLPDCPLLLELKEPPESNQPVDDARRSIEFLNGIKLDD
jgi:sugar phosphate isomerase/epimerase